VREDVESSVTSISSFQENIFVTIRCQDNSKLLLGNIYRSPNSDIGNDAELFNLIDTVCCLSNTQLLLVGDFNFPDIDWNSWSPKYNSSQSSKFIEVLRDHMLLQHVNVPTRARGSDNPHTLDLVITNDYSVSNIDYMAPLGNSDHMLLDIYYNISGTSQEQVNKFNYSKGEYSNLRKVLNIDWKSVLLQRVGIASYAERCISHDRFCPTVRPSVCHTPVSCQNHSS